jgi:hypothetical protein
MLKRLYSRQLATHLIHVCRRTKQTTSHFIWLPTWKLSRHATSSTCNNLIGRLQSVFYNTKLWTRWNRERKMTTWSIMYHFECAPNNTDYKYRQTPLCNIRWSVVIHFLVSLDYRPSLYLATVRHLREQLELLACSRSSRAAKNNIPLSVLRILVQVIVTPMVRCREKQYTVIRAPKAVP